MSDKITCKCGESFYDEKCFVSHYRECKSPASDYSLRRALELLRAIEWQGVCRARNLIKGCPFCAQDQTGHADDCEYVKVTDEIKDALGSKGCAVHTKPNKNCIPCYPHETVKSDD